MSQLTCPKPYKILRMFVCVAAAIIGGYFGRLAYYGLTGLYVAGIGGHTLG